MKTTITLSFTVLLCLMIFTKSQSQTNFTAIPDSGCAPLSVTFTNTGTGAASYFWDFGDGNTYSGTDTTHIYTTPGFYDVLLIGLDTASNPIDTATATINVVGSSGVFFIFNDSICLGETADFFSPDFSSIYFWSFGDGAIDSSSGQFVSYNYFADGIYQVDLVVNTVCGLDTISDTVWVNSGFLPPTPAIAAFPDSICPGEIITFTSDIDPAVPYLWDFGDGTLDSTSATYFFGTHTITHPYLSTGNFTATLTVRNQCNNTNSSNYTITVDNSAVPPPPTITALQDSICPGETITFTADIDTTIPYLWNFGDGSVDSTGAQDFFGFYFITHTFVDSGNYTVSLTVRNQCGNSNSSSDTVHIINSTVPPPPAFSISADSVCPGDNITFSAFLDAGIPFALWNFGDGITDTSFPQIFGVHSITHSFSNANSYTVTLTIQNQCGNTGSFSDTVTIINSSPMPPPNFFAVPPTACLGDAITFSLFLDASVPYLWDFGDGTLDNSSAQNFFGFHTISHIYNSMGNFEVILTVSNACGNSASDTAAIFIAPLPNPVITQSGNVLSVTDTFSSYQWFQDDSIINGANGQSYLATTNGNYYVVVTDANFCIDTSNIIGVILGMNEYPFDNLGLTISPNPFSQQTEIKYSLATNSQIKIELYNLLGQKIKIIAEEKEVSGEHRQILEVEKNNEIYFLKISVNNINYFQKIIQIQ